MLEQESEEKQTVFADWLENVEGWPWREIRWQAALLLAGPLPLVIFLFCRDFWDQHVGFILFDVLIVGGLYILHYYRKFWRENRWIVMPAAFVILVWVNSIWMQAYWSVENLQNPKIFPPQPGSLALHVVYPQQILYDAAEIPSISMWWKCSPQPCEDEEVKITTRNQSLLFAVKDENPPAWTKTLVTTLPASGREIEILVRRSEPVESQWENLFVITTRHHTPYPVGDIWMEGAQNAKNRKFWLELLKSSSVVITIITAALAALKQLDEQKQGTRRKRIDELLSRVKNYEYKRGKAKEFLVDVQAELHDWGEWLPEQREELRKMFEKFVELVIDKSKSQEHYSSETSSWAESAIAIVETLAYPDGKTKALTEKVKQSAPGYSSEGYASLFPPERYPLQRRFARQSISMPEKETWGLLDWQMRFAPFDDNLDAQFRYVKDDNFPLLAAVNFPFLATRFSNQTCFFQNAWDLRAGYYQFCRAFTALEFQQRSKQTFFVPVFPEAIPVWEEKIECQEYLLHNLAAAWLRVLANAPDIIDKMGLWEIEALARLVAWHYGSASAIQVLSLPAESQIIRHVQGIRPEKAFPVGEKTRWLALRPPGASQTLYLYTQVSLDGMVDVPGAVNMTTSLASALEKESVFVARFLLTEQPGHLPVLQMNSQDLLVLLNERVRLSTAGSKIFWELFSEHPLFDDLLEQFLSRADGSPGKMLSLARAVLENHLQRCNQNPDINPENLL